MGEPHPHAVQTPHWSTPAGITGPVAALGQFDVSFIDVTPNTILNFLP